jgi:pimeloyl-ACP methyl ester carboxylesterase
MLLAMPRFESFDGVRLAYEIDGDGAPVLLVHGYVTDAYINWIRPGIVDRLKSAGYSAITIDQRAHGMSDKPHDLAAYANGAMVKDLGAFLDHLGLDRCLAAGYSMGARNLLELLLSGEKRVRAAVLGGVGANMLASRQTGESISDAMLAEDKSTITNGFAKGFRDFADLTRGDRVALAAIMQQPREPLAGFEAIDIQVLVLCAADDPMIGNPQDLASKISDARVATVGGTHLNVVNNPEFHREMLAFLDEHRDAVA